MKSWTKDSLWQRLLDDSEHPSSPCSVTELQIYSRKHIALWLVGHLNEFWSMRCNQTCCVAQSKKIFTVGNERALFPLSFWVKYKVTHGIQTSLLETCRIFCMAEKQNMVLIPHFWSWTTASWIVLHFYLGFTIRARFISWLICSLWGSGN